MKRILLSLALVLSLLTARAQSDSFMALKEKFSGSSDVFCFGTNGFWARAALWATGEHEFNDAVRRIDNIQLIVVPMEAFRKKGVTVSGYKRVLHKDDYAELVRFRDDGEEVTVYLKDSGQRNNCYLVLVEEPGEFVAIHFEGYIDPNVLMKDRHAL